MNVLAINGSPHGAAGNTEVLVRAFLEGACEAGATTDTIYLMEKTIHHCVGCFSCWTKTPGVCVHDDDMPEILEQVKTADVLVYAMPLYTYTMPGLMKDFVDRCLPFAHAAIVKRGDHYGHPSRWEARGRTSVLISNAGFPELHHFDGLKRTFELLHAAPEAVIAGTICCGAGPLLRIPGMEADVSWYLDAVQKAGRDVVTSGQFAAETQTTLDRPLAPDPGAYAEMVNAYWEGVGVEMPVDAKAATSAPPTVGAALGDPLPPPAGRETMADLVAGMPLAFSAGAAGDLVAVIQFDVTDETPGAYFVTIEGGTCTAYAGTHPAPSLTIHTPADVWMKISRGELGGPRAFMERQFSITGDMNMLMKLGSLFSVE